MSETPNELRRDEERRREIVAELGTLGFCLQGSLGVRYLRCGNPRCRCRQSPENRHGPYIYWTRKVSGRTVSRLLSAEQAERYRPWFEDGKRLRKLVRELEALSIRAAERAEGWGEK